MAESILITGFPGFLGSRLISSIIAIRPETTFISLVQPKFMHVAQQTAERVLRDSAGAAGNITLIEGDITLPGLGLSPEDTELASKADACFHLAALYDLTVSRETGMRVNLHGTENILDFLSGCESLRRLYYISTCYVSGNHTGIFPEDEIDVGQSFKNYYEETKYLAEVEVRRRMGDIPTTIFRPSIVIGDSRTGVTDKFDGPYFVFSFFSRLPRYTLAVTVGDGSTKVNLVPSDYVISAITHLSGTEKSLGKTYNLADPNPRTVRELQNEINRLMDRRLHFLRVPAFLARGFLHPSLISKFFGMPPELIDYFRTDVDFDVSNTISDLSGSGISCPGLFSYLPVIHDYWNKNRSQMSYKPMA